MRTTDSLSNPDDLRLFLEGEIALSGSDPTALPHERFAFAYEHTLSEVEKRWWRVAAGECLRGELNTWTDAGIYELLRVISICTPAGAFRLLEHKIVGAALERRFHHGHPLRLQAVAVAAQFEVADWLRDWLLSALVRQPSIDVVLLCLSAFASRADAPLQQALAALFRLPIRVLEEASDLQFQLYSAVKSAGMRRFFDSLFGPNAETTLDASENSRRYVFEELHEAVDLLRDEDAWFQPLAYLTRILKDKAPANPSAHATPVLDSDQTSAVKLALAVLTRLGAVSTPERFVADDPHGDDSVIFESDDDYHLRRSVSQDPDADWERESGLQSPTAWQAAADRLTALTAT